MPNTYTELQRTVLGSNTQTVTLSNIPQGYTDLRLVIVPASSSGTNGIRMRVGNGSVDTGSNYSGTYVDGNGTNAASYRESSVTQFVLSYRLAINTTLTQMYTLDFLNYSNTTTNKTVLVRYNDAAAASGSSVLLWRSTSAINTLSFNINSFGSSTGDFITGSTFSLYGIANADLGSAKATGGMITEDATYWYHTFGASGAFIPKQSLTCDVLVVAGGGGGGFSRGGAGGAGGLLYYGSQSLTAISHNVTVGAGGTGGTSGNGGTGVNSQFASLTASAGGGGGASGSITFSVGQPGGSGGGACGSGSGAVQAGGAATPSGQGNVGGDSATTGFFGAGGGGATVAGANATSTTPGNGGNGSSAYSSWGIATGTGQNIAGTVWYAGGGGGGRNSAGTGALAGNGGGGAGGATADQVGFPGQAFTGGGGGGGANTTVGTNGGNGGSGIVIVRYAK